MGLQSRVLPQAAGPSTPKSLQSGDGLRIDNGKHADSRCGPGVDFPAASGSGISEIESQG